MYQQVVVGINLIKFNIRTSAHERYERLVPAFTNKLHVHQQQKSIVIMTHMDYGSPPIGFASLASQGLFFRDLAAAILHASEEVFNG